MFPPLETRHRPRDCQSLTAIGGSSGCQGDGEASPGRLGRLKGANELKFLGGRVGGREVAQIPRALLFTEFTAPVQVSGAAYSVERVEIQFFPPASGLHFISTPTNCPNIRDAQPAFLLR